MTEEKAIDYFKSYINAIDTYGTIDKNCCNKLYEPAQVVLDLVEKLQKENEKLKNKVAKRNNELIELEETSEKEFLTKIEVKANYIPKDKIRKKLKAREEDREDCDNSIIANNLLRDIYLLRELLEEE